MDDPLETAELLAFTRTVDAKSLSRAAAELGIPRATIGRRLQRLETRLGVRLLKRTTRSLTLTDAGEHFYRQARIALDAVKQAAQSVAGAHGGMCGELRVSIPSVIDEAFEDMLLDFVRDHPNVKLSVDVSTRHVDLNREGYDVAIRAAIALEPGLIARTLMRTRLLGVASPRYIAAMGEPKSLKDLGRHRCLTGFMRGELPSSFWPLPNGRKLNVASVFGSNDVRLLMAAACRDGGIAFLPEMLVDEALASGRLVQVLPKVLELPVRVALVYRERELMPPPQKAFIEAVTAWSAAYVRHGGQARTYSRSR